MTLCLMSMFQAGSGFIANEAYTNTVNNTAFNGDHEESKSTQKKLISESGKVTRDQ